jgi:hypothetical protein
MNANFRGRVRKLESRRGSGSRTLLVWAWGKSDTEIEKATADLHPGPDDIVLPVTWPRPAVASNGPWGTLAGLNIAERDELRSLMEAEVAKRAQEPSRP